MKEQDRKHSGGNQGEDGAGGSELYEETPWPGRFSVEPLSPQLWQDTFVSSQTLSGYSAYRFAYF